MRWLTMILVGLIGTLTVQADESKGSLVIIGGALRYGDREVWERVVALAGGPGAKIAILPMASNAPLASGERTAAALNRVGARAFVVPIAFKGVDTDPHQAAADPALVEQVRTAGGVYFLGGDQERITHALHTPDGHHTPMLDAVWDVYHRGGVIAGTSAGAAIMSRVMFRDAPIVLHTLLHGVKMGQEISPGLGFIGPDWFIEQHCLARGRFARALVAMHANGFRFGLGIEENSALVVRHGEVQVIGYKGALVLDLSEVTTDKSIPGFNLKNIKLTYLDRGDRIKLATREVIPAPEKVKGRFDPNAPDFKPYYQQPVFCNDILGNCAVSDLMVHLIDNTHSEAIGLAFDGAAARKQEVDGFEFRFHRARDTHGWHTPDFGGEDYTVANIHLDIRPIRIAGPLYK